MNYLNTFKIALTAIRRNKLRAFLTMLGIIIGVASVIAMLAMGEGSKSYIKNQMSGLGTNLVMIMPGAEAHGPVRSSGTSKLEMSDLEAIARNQYVAAISPLVQSSAQAVSYTHLRAHETRHDLVCRLLLEKKKKKKKQK